MQEMTNTARAFLLAQDQTENMNCQGYARGRVRLITCQTVRSLRPIGKKRGEDDGLLGLGLPDKSRTRNDDRVLWWNNLCSPINHLRDPHTHSLYIRTIFVSQTKNRTNIRPAGVTMTSQNCYSPQSSLTPWQARAFLLFIILMLADLVITSWGFLNIPGFVEANPFYAGFASFPTLFLNTIVWAKVAAIAGILLVVEWFNIREPADAKLHGGNLVCLAAVVGMTTMLSTFLYLNATIIL